MKKSGIPAVIAAVAGGIAVWQVISYMEIDKKGESIYGDSRDKGRMTEGRLKEYLLRLFQLFNDDSTSGQEGSDGLNIWEQEAQDYAELLYPYIKRNMKTVFQMEGDDGHGNEPFHMTDELFCVPACRIYREPSEQVYDNFALEWEQELWMLEDGRFAVVDRMKLVKDGWSLIYRKHARDVREHGDIPFAFEDLESGFAEMAEEIRKDSAAFEKA